MKREYYKWQSNHLGREMELLVFGHAGDPILFFPTRTARFYDYEDWQVIDAMRKRIESGSIQVFCLDSVDRESFYSKELHPAQRICRHLDYERYILQEVLPLVKYLNPNPTFTAAGCSLGAYHAANLAFKYPNLFHKMVGLSGRYDLTTSMEHFDDLVTDRDIHLSDIKQYLARADVSRPFLDLAFEVGQKVVAVRMNFESLAVGLVALR